MVPRFMQSIFAEIGMHFDMKVTLSHSGKLSLGHDSQWQWSLCRKMFSSRDMKNLDGT